MNSKILVFFPLVALLILSGFIGGKWYFDSQQAALIDAAQEVFNARYPDAPLIALGELHDTWVYRYMDGDQLVEIIRLGDDWLKVQRP